MRMDRLGSIMRFWVLIVALIYLNAIALVFVVLVLQGDYGDFAEAAPLVSPAMAALVAFIWGLTVWNTRRAWITRAVAWLVLAISSVYPFVSMSFVLTPVVISALPAIWPWQVRLRRRDSR